MLLSALLLAVVGGLTATRLFGQVLRLPTILLVPVIMLFITVGVYAVNNTLFDLYLFFAIGVVAYFLEKLDYPSAPIILGVILCPIAETQLHLALTISGGNTLVLVSSPLSIILVLLTLFILLPLIAVFAASYVQPEITWV